MKSVSFIVREPYFVNVKYVGSVNRNVRWKTTRNDDVYFSQYVQSKFDLEPREKWGEYDLAHTNEAALLPSLLKYDKPLYPVNDVVWSVAEQWCMKHFSCAMGSHELKGTEDVFEQMEKKTSPGYPFTLVPGTFSKRQVISSPVMKKICYDYNDRIEQESTSVLWAVHEKEEIRSRLKLEMNRIRTFVGSSIDFLFSCMCMFWDMNLKLYEAAAKNLTWSYVGGTKYYGGWNKTFQRLNKHPNAYELDEEDYDCSLAASMMKSCARVRCAFLDADKGQRKKIENLYEEIINSFMVLPGGEILKKMQGNPSGSFNTITDNTLILYMLLAYAWLQLAPEDMRTYEAFHANVEAILCGDDNTWTVSDKANTFFNAKSVAKIWTQIGIKTKSDVWEPRKLEDCWFVSNQFATLEHPILKTRFAVPVPETAKIMASMAFHSKGNARWSLLRAAALRIESFYNYECRALIVAYITWLMTTYYDELHSEKNPTDPNDIFTFDEVMSVFKTDDEIRALYLGYDLEGKRNLSPDVLMDRSEGDFNFADMGLQLNSEAQ